MEINVAKSAGFCYGVKRAINFAEEALKSGGNLYSIGNIVHNKFIIDELSKKGMISVKNIDDIPDKSFVIIRAHGITKQDMLKCEEKKLNIIDATCPNVKKVHNLVSKYSLDGYNIIVIGESEHPEVTGIKGWSSENVIVVDENFDFEQLKNISKVCIVSQTTMNGIKNEEIIKKMKKYLKSPVIFNTICAATDERQKELKELAKIVDTMIIIGDKMSSNSNRLYEISREICKNSYFIENIDELCLNFLDNSCRIGITAGASTPESLINEVIVALKSIK